MKIRFPGAFLGVSIDGSQVTYACMGVIAESVHETHGKTKHEELGVMHLAKHNIRPIMNLGRKRKKS
jgi:hypothetical protein